ncbi:MAG: hypothetical protein IT379_25275 [Deltaproteobacteria bacterium]|nr:hypothetical protein [Deltaproteobacteria bacterium]
MAALKRYSQEHPDGHFIDRVREERVALEAAYWEAGQSSRSGLQLYLDMFPDGPHAEEARPRFEALQGVASRGEDAAAKQREIARQRLVQQAEERRTWLRRSAIYWLQTMVRLTSWGSPIPEVARQNGEFSRAFGQEPRPRCTPTECVKHYQNSYFVPVPGQTRVDRSVSFDLRLVLREGRLVSAELLLPNLGMSRWFEMENQEIVEDGDEGARRRAVAWAVAILRESITASFDGAREVPVRAASLVSPIERDAAGKQDVPQCPGDPQETEDAVPNGCHDGCSNDDDPFMDCDDFDCRDECRAGGAADAGTATPPPPAADAGTATPPPPPRDAGTATPPPPPPVATARTELVFERRAGGDTLRVEVFSGGAADQADGVRITLNPSGAPTATPAPEPTPEAPGRRPRRRPR